MPVGDPATEQVALGPVIDERQRDKIHSLVTASVDAGATLERRVDDPTGSWIVMRDVEGNEFCVS